MTNTSHAHSFGPDFKKMSVDFDRFMGLIKPVGEAIIYNIEQLEDGAHVLDVACGTGEPGITLARARRKVQIVGIDAVENMINLATTKSQNEKLNNLKFKIMQSENLQFDDDTFDCVISRFGLGMFGDTVGSIKESTRALKSQGCFSIAVWHDMSKNTLVKTVVDHLKKILSAEVTPEFSKLFEKSPGASAVENFKDAGCKSVKNKEFTWIYNFESAEHLKQFLKGPAVMMFGKVLDKMDATEVESAMQSVFEEFSQFRKDDGTYAIPHTCLLVFGRK